MEDFFRAADIRGVLHMPEAHNGDGIILAHGAGSNCNAPLLVEVSRALEAAGFLVLRCDLPFRQQRRTGPPLPLFAPRDRAGLRNAADAVRHLVRGKLFLGGHSYGGRQSTILAAEEPGVAAGLLLLSYPLHPPRRPQELRTAHFHDLRIPSVFVHGSRDPFGKVTEMEAALRLIPAPTSLLVVDGAGHELKSAATHTGEMVTRLRAVTAA